MTSFSTPRTFATAIVAVAGGLGVIIPPSIPFIMYAMATGESVSDLFLAGIVPGLMIGALLMFYAYYHCRRYGEDKEKIDAKVTELREKGFLNILKDSIWALISLGHYGGSHENICTDPVYPCCIHCLLKSADLNAGSTDSERMDLSTFQ